MMLVFLLFTACGAAAISGDGSGKVSGPVNRITDSTDGTDIGDPGLLRLAEWMTGLFSSHQQAVSDPSFSDVRLSQRRIWESRADAIWIYVEQALAGMEDQPYRQRIYRVSRVGEMLESMSFEIPHPERFANRLPEECIFFTTSPADLVEREGCAILLQKSDKGFSGSTLGKECLSLHRGASYATSHVVISAGKMESWDRGFDREGNQVWGSERGGYLFNKIKDYKPYSRE